MTSREFNRIQTGEKEVLDKYLTEYPVKLGQIAIGLGVSIKVSSLGTGVSGQIKN